MRKVIASRLTESKATVPHYYTSMDCRLDAVLEMRKALKAAGVGASVNDVVIRAAALALRDVPRVNSYWDTKAQAVVGNESVDVSVAVATPTGLITPIVKDADSKGLAGISGTVRELAGRARDGKLKPEEFQGGSFTISNLGMFGISEFTAVINAPQSCIMAVGGGIHRAVPSSGGADEASSDDALEAATMMTVCLSSDRRVVDEVTAARFLDVFRSYVESPAKLYG